MEIYLVDINLAMARMGVHRLLFNWLNCRASEPEREHRAFIRTSSPQGESGSVDLHGLQTSQ